MAAWKIAPALAAGNCTVLKPASPTPWSILKLAELIEDIVPPGVLNIVNGPGRRDRQGAGDEQADRQDRVHRRDRDRAADHAVRGPEHHPVDDRAGRQVAEHLLRRRDGEDDEFLDKAIEGLVLYAFNKGEVCTCPSRALIEESIYDEFMERVLERIATIKQGHSLDPETQIGPRCRRPAREDRELRPRSGSTRARSC